MFADEAGFCYPDGCCDAAAFAGGALTNQSSGLSDCLILSDIGKAVPRRFVIERSPGENGNIVNYHRLLRPYVPANMDEVRCSENANGAVILVTAEPHEM